MAFLKVILANLVNYLLFPKLVEKWIFITLLT